ncbi:ARM repeat-containing protein [Piedraia hortae CBS 480.64]|uniref:ARM repeat-containing protein n=1 Tax=Piedraia hortae CBS 480.64 TaxID=1314780 RepID=A0A6A7BX87_9PEZI|nr:ARM repeat-containing protein [Piedraia hortae CBS 480.64]
MSSTDTSDYIGDIIKAGQSEMSEDGGGPKVDKGTKGCQVHGVGNVTGGGQDTVPAQVTEAGTRAVGQSIKAGTSLGAQYTEACTNTGGQPTKTYSIAGRLFTEEGKGTGHQGTTVGRNVKELKPPPEFYSNDLDDQLQALVELFPIMREGRPLTKSAIPRLVEFIKISNKVLQFKALAIISLMAPELKEDLIAAGAAPALENLILAAPVLSQRAICILAVLSGGGKACCDAVIEANVLTKTNLSDLLLLPSIETQRAVALLFRNVCYYEYFGIEPDWEKIRPAFAYFPRLIISPDPEVLVHICYAMHSAMRGGIKFRSEFPRYLVELLSHSTWEVRCAAAHAISRMTVLMSDKLRNHLIDECKVLEPLETMWHGNGPEVEKDIDRAMENLCKTDDLWIPERWRAITPDMLDDW